MADFGIEDMIERIELSIKIVIPDKEDEFINFLKNSYKPIRFIDFDNLHHSLIQFNVSFLEALRTIPEKYPQFNNPQYVEYFVRVQKVFAASFLNDKTIEDDAKIYAINELEDWKQNIEFIYPEFKGSQALDDTLDYLKIIQNRLHNKELDLLFDKIVIERVDAALRKGHWINSESDSLLNVLQRDNWINNLHCINWQRDQQALLYLFALLNGNERKIQNGTITELISKTFKIKNEIKTEAQLSNSLGNFFNKYLAKGTKKTQELEEIEGLYKSCLP